MARLFSEWSPRRECDVYKARYRVGGRVLERTLGTDRLAAEVAYAEVERLEREARRDSQTVQDGAGLRERFLGALRLKGCRPGTLAYYTKHLDRWLAFVGDAPPARWTPALLTEHFAAHPAWGPRRLRMVCATLKRVARVARRLSLFVPDITDGIELPRTVRKARRDLRVEEVDRVLAVVRDHRYEVPVALAVFAGLSLGDLYALTWAEVDVAAGWLIRPSGREKTGQPLRVPLLPDLAEALRRRAPLHRAPADRVCALIPKRRENTGETLRRIYARAGLPGLGGWHLLRHAFGRMLMRAKVPEPAIRMLLSHEPKSVITGIYTEPDDRDRVEAVQALGAYLAQQRAAAT